MSHFTGFHNSLDVAHNPVMTASLATTENVPPQPCELLAPAGDWECVAAAIENGADAVYFGLDCGFNARHRAKNFGLDELPAVFRLLRRRGVRGYVTANTLVFPSEMSPLVDVIEKIALAGADAILVQDFGVARLARTICPELEIHASTQMSLSSAETIQVAQQLGLSRAVLARELSVAEIRKIAAQTDMPLEVFIHGALCVAYSGQCLTSESLGGRSANRGQCAQACRLPYDLICDGEDRDLDDVRFLLSPQDLAGYGSIVDLLDAGVASLKIEGRLKTPEYVANITGQYRKAIDEAVARKNSTIDAEERREMELSFSRGFSPGWLEGNDHKRLVPGLYSSKRGIKLGTIEQVTGGRIQLRVDAPVALGDGLAIVGKAGDSLGGRIYSLHTSSGQQAKQIDADEIASIGFGRGEIDWSRVHVDDQVYKNDDPALNRRLRKTYSGEDPRRRTPIDLHAIVETGKPLQLTARVDGIVAEVASEQILERATKHPIDESVLREKLGRLGGTPFQLGELTASIVDQPMVPMALLNQLRRDLVETLVAKLEKPRARRVDVQAARALLAPVDSESETASPSRLSVLCRTLQQCDAACRCGVDLVYADFQDIRQYGEAVATAAAHNVAIGLASIRMHKPGENGLLKAIGRHRPDLVLARNLAAIDYCQRQSQPVVADFSLNCSNHRSAEWLHSLGAARITASYDLNRQQLMEFVDSCPSNWLEIVIHQHMPMFHMEHCVFCSVLSPGTNKTNCGRPCDRHVVQLRDRVGAEHTLTADIACRNTLFNATPQSGAESVTDLADRGVSWFRIELLAEDAAQTATTIDLYRRLLDGRASGRDVWQGLKASNRVGVTRGTLESRRDPLAII